MVFESPDGIHDQCTHCLDENEEFGRDLGATRDRAVRCDPGAGVAGNQARAWEGTGEGFGMPEPRRGGLGGGGIIRYTSRRLVRTLVHVI